MVRRSPNEHAGPMDLGVEMEGNDGNMYVVAERSNGVHYWSPSESMPKRRIAKKRSAAKKSVAKKSIAKKSIAKRSSSVSRFKKQTKKRNSSQSPRPRSKTQTRRRVASRSRSASPKPVKTAVKKTFEIVPLGSENKEKDISISSWNKSIKYHSKFWDHDKKVLIRGSFKFVIDYPLKKPFIFSASNQALTFHGIISLIARSYKKIYSQKSAYGVYGHGIEDLAISGLKYNRNTHVLKIDVSS